MIIKGITLLTMLTACLSFADVTKMPKWPLRYTKRSKDIFSVRIDRISLESALNDLIKKNQSSLSGCFGYRDRKEVVPPRFKIQISKGKIVEVENLDAVRNENFANCIGKILIGKTILGDSKIEIEITLVPVNLDIVE